MESIAWRLLNDGHLLEIYKVNHTTRQMTLILPLRRSQRMTDEEAKKYVDDNYPESGSAVRMAAEVLGIARKDR